MKPSEVLIDNSTAFSSYGISLGMETSNSNLLSSTTHLDSHITEDSGLRCALQVLIKLDPELTRITVGMKEEQINKYFNDHSKMFATHAFINFVTGFNLTNQEYARFVQPKKLDVRDFEAMLGSHPGLF